MTDKLQLRIERLAYGGDAIAHRDDGKTVFVAGGCPGDLLSVTITDDKPGFLKASIDEVVEASENRMAPRCPYHALCGGCPWQHVDYSQQLEAKRGSVVDAMTRIGKFDEPRIEGLCAQTLPSDAQWGYRNKVEFEVVSDGKRASGFKLGLHSHGGGLVPVESCPLLPGKMAKAPKALSGALRYLEGTGNLWLVRVGVRTSTRTHSTEVALWTHTGSFPRSRVAKVLGDAVGKADVTRVLIKGSQKERKVTGVEVLSGKGYWTERINGDRMMLSAPSFFQVNTATAEKLVETVLDGLQVNENSQVLDLYSGAGTFTLPLAEITDQVIAVESYGSSVRDLRRNLEERGLIAEVVGGDVAYELPDLTNADSAVVDPPRAGLATEVVDQLCDLRIPRLVYVSCNPTTLARDLQRLCTDVYELESLTPVDLFPQTYHVETVATLRCRLPR